MQGSWPFNLVDFSDKVDESSSTACNCYTGCLIRQPVIIKTVIYRCGCKVVLSDFRQKETGHCCIKHIKGVKKIITEEIY